MLLKDIIDVDFVNYQKPAMILGFTKCSFKCDKEFGQPICQNCKLINEPNVEVATNEVIKRYLKNDTVHAMVCQGLEPLDSWDELFQLLGKFREKTNDDFVIYTGYNKCEISDKIKYLQKYKNIIVKFGRYIPNQKPHYDAVLGVDLASDNQYAEKIS